MTRRPRVAASPRPRVSASTPSASPRRRVSASADTAAVIVAGGQGLRFGGRVRKQYVFLRGRPILWWSLKAFEKARSIGAIILVVPKEDVVGLKARSRPWKIQKPLQVVSGGATRADSVSCGLSAVPRSFRYVAVHDAVRPLITPQDVEAVIRAARRFKAALAACPSGDTVKLANGGHLVKQTPPRDTVWLAQTPQVFEASVLRRAHAPSPRARRRVTDDAELVERLGVRVKLVPSSPHNMKVTHPMDLHVADMILSVQSRGHSPRPRVAASPRRRVAASPRPRVATSPRPL